MNNADWILSKSRTQTLWCNEKTPSIEDTSYVVMDVSFQRERLRPMQELVDELNDYYREELGETEGWTSLSEFLLQLLLEKSEEVDAFDRDEILTREKSRMENSPIRALRKG
mgnify:CR=1 FL=1